MEEEVLEGQIPDEGRQRDRFTAIDGNRTGTRRGTAAVQVPSERQKQDMLPVRE